jgi:SAM-dependent methyltransferase
VGTYLGVDVLKPQVRWCARRFGGNGFRFRHVDIASERYNPDGKLAVSDLELDDARFDVIVAFGLFTHMWPDDVLAHLRVIAGSLAMDGHAAATVFLLDPDAKADQAAPQMPFEREPGCRYESEDDPLDRVGYELPWLVRKAAEVGLAPAGPPLFGTWSSRPIDRQRQPGYQDLFVFSRFEDALRRR